MGMGSVTVSHAARLSTAAAELSVNDCSRLADFEQAFQLPQNMPLEQLLDQDTGKASAYDFNDASGTFTDSGHMNIVGHLPGSFALPADSFPDLDVRCELGRVADSAICPEALSIRATVPQCSNDDMTPWLMRTDPDQSVGNDQRLEHMSTFGNLQVESSPSAGIPQPSVRRQSQDLLSHPLVSLHWTCLCLIAVLATTTAPS
jgi:hypothetical protein